MKETISYEQAVAMFLKQAFDKDETIQNEIYSLALSRSRDVIDEIEEKYTIVDINGEPFNSEVDEVCWYDDSREDFIHEVMAHVAQELTNEE